MVWHEAVYSHKVGCMVSYCRVPYYPILCFGRDYPVSAQLVCCAIVFIKQLKTYKINRDNKCTAKYRSLVRSPDQQYTTIWKTHPLLGLCRGV